MGALVPDRLDEPLTRSAMAKQAGVSATSLANWSARESKPLLTVAAPNGDVLYTWRNLLSFCAANPNLPATREVRERYRERFPEATSTQPRERVARADSRRITGSAASGASDSYDGVTLRSALQELKTKVGEHSVVVGAAAKLAEDAARIQASLVERIEVLEGAVAGVPGADE